MVDEALLGLARTTLRATVVLASHQLQLVEALADEAVVLAHGRVIAQAGRRLCLRGAVSTAASRRARGVGLSCGL